jgi:hypothetical protein
LGASGVATDGGEVSADLLECGESVGVKRER